MNRKEFRKLDNFGEYEKYKQFENIKSVKDTVYITDVGNYCIYKFSVKKEVNFLGETHFPWGIAVDSKENIFFTDFIEDSSIQKITRDGTLHTFSGTKEKGYENGDRKKAQFNCLFGIVVDSFGNLYVADSGNHCIRKITPEGIVSTFCNEGIRESNKRVEEGLKFRYPCYLAIDPKNNIYVTCYYQHCIWKITPEGKARIFAGRSICGYTDGFDSKALFNSPEGLNSDNNNNIYVADRKNHCIRKITPEGIVSTFAGNSKMGSVDGPKMEAQFYNPSDLAVDSSGIVYIIDSDYRSIRKVTTEGFVETLNFKNS